MIGLAELEHGQADRARPWFDEALTAFRKTREAGSEASIDSLLANRLDHLGKGDEAWRAQLAALVAAARAGDPWPLVNIFSAAARILSEKGQPAEAAHFQDEVLEMVKGSGDMQLMAEAHWWRAKIYFRAGDLASARWFIAKAEDDCDHIADQKTARSTRAGVAAEAGRLWLDTDPQRALKSFTRALDLYEDNAYSRTEILLGRARAHRARREDHDAERDLISAMDEHERQRDSIQTGPLRVAYFETAQQVLDDLVALELDSLHAPDRAFDYAERSRARALLDTLAARHLAPARPFATTEVERGLPPGTVLVEYAVLPDRVVAWTRGTGRAWRSIAWRKADLEAAVARLAKTITGPSGDAAADRAEFDSQSAALFGRLIAPILDQVPQGATLVVVPDGALRELPFAALREAQSGSFLVERNPLIVAPSATIFLAPSAHRADRPRDRWQSLAVGNPTIDLELYPDHGLLPKTEQEAREVAKAHPGSLLVQNDATVPAFLAALDRFELIHFAGHAGVASTPPRPALLFAPAAGPFHTGALDAGAIAARRLSRPRLAVLAACSAAGGSSLGLEGGADLARSFFEAGVPAVVANLWSLGDEDASVFLGAFYRSFWQGRSATSALREAQLAMIHHPETRFHRPAVWGGFRLLGTAAGQGLH
jgi:CHAT domain-containing protein